MNTVAALVARAPVPPADVDPSTGKGPEWGKAAPVGLLVILLLCIAVVFLLRSMVRRINRVPGEFEARERGTNTDDHVPGGQPAGLAHPSAIGGETVSAPDPEPEPGSPGLVNERSG